MIGTAEVDPLPPDLADWVDSESTPILSPERLLEPVLLQSRLHRLAPNVPVSGGLAVFTMQTPFGEQPAEGREMLEIRVSELEAIERLAGESSWSTFVAATGEAASRTGEAVVNVVSDPLGTAAGLPSGIARYFRQGYRSLRRTTMDAADAARADRDRADDAQTEEAAGGAEVSGQEDSEPTAADDSRSQGAVESAALRLIGYGKARRELARRLDVDPHTTNPLLSKQLDELAWSGLAGRAGFGLALGTVGTVSQIASAAGRLNRLVWELSPMQIRDHNERALSRAGFTGPGVRAFLRNGAFHPSLQLDFCYALIALEGVAGRFELLELAAEANDEIEARLVVNFLRMVLQLQDDEAERAAAIHAGDQLLWVSLADTRPVALLPIDYLSATPWLARLIEEPLSSLPGSPAPRLRIAGQVSAAAKDALEAGGWQIQAQVGLGAHVSDR